MEICVMQDLFNRPRPTTRLPNAKEKNTVSQCPWDEKQSELRGAIFFTKTPSQDTGSQNKAEECKESSHDSIAKGHRHSDLIRSDDHCVTLWAEC